MPTVLITVLNISKNGHIGISLAFNLASSTLIYLGNMYRTCGISNFFRTFWQRVVASFTMMPFRLASECLYAPCHVVSV